MRKIAALAGMLALSACAAGPAPMPTTTPTLMTTTGLEAVLGATAAGLTQLFGEPDQDFQEPNARKLQFTNGSCVLDTYLYAERDGGEPVVTYVDARNPAGEDVDRAACVEALRR